MNRTSRSSRAVRIAARSPARSTAGPLVYRTFTPSSRAMIVASVVLPRPGGPYSRTWSAASPLPFAAWSRTSRLALTSRWPMYSSSVRGRSDPSTATSPGSEAPAARRLRPSSVIGAESSRIGGIWYRCSTPRSPDRIVQASRMDPSPTCPIGCAARINARRFGLHSGECRRRCADRHVPRPRITVGRDRSRQRTGTSSS